ncbi:MAG: SH3 domain-containing protein [Xanthomonadales bacterium]|nr:SH3 domain-containing protein [Xanthomonadales bacterium]
MQQSPDYWIGKMERAGDVLRGPEWIEAFNANSYEADPNLVDLTLYPDRVPGREVARLIRSVSKPGETDLYYRDDPGQRKVGPEDYERYQASLALDAIPETVHVRFGLVLQRTNMRTWPARDFVFRSPETRDLDRFQENGLFPGEMVVILHESADGFWCFVRSYNYGAWIRKPRLVEGRREEVLGYARTDRFLVVTGSRAMTNFNPADPDTSELCLDMGVRLPLTDPDKLPLHVGGQNPVASFAVQLPARDEQGGLAFKTVLIGRGQDVREGYLPYTPENIIRQSFKFLGERYGWGHSYNARDCTGLVLEVFRSMGIMLPRNSAQQGASPIGETVLFSEHETVEERLEVLAGAEVGDLVYSPGHAMIFLGFDEGEPYVIHDMSGSGWVDDNGDPIEGIMNGVAVTSLLSTKMSPEWTYFEKMYAIKKIR